MASNHLRKSLHPCCVPQNLTVNPPAATTLRVMRADSNRAGTTGESSKERYFVKSKVPNLLLLMPSGIYCGRGNIKGKVHKASFETASFEVANKKLKVWMQEQRGKPTSDSTLGTLAEEYAQGLQLQGDTGGIKSRTRAT